MKTYFTSLNGQLYLSEMGLISSGMNKRTLENQISFNKKSTEIKFECIKVDGIKWILYESIPERILKKFNLFFRSNEIAELICNDKKYIEDKKSLITYKKIRFILHQACSDERFWMPFKVYYKDYLLDNDNWNLFSKTHAVFAEILELKTEYILIDIHKAYNTLDSVVFKTSSYKYFTEKVRVAEKIGIDDCLIHDFRRYGRDPYKLNDLTKRRIKYYYSLPKRYSAKKIASLVNEELVKRNLKTVSYSTVQRFIANQELKNISDPMRYGKQYAKDNIDPYIIRKKPLKSGDVLEIDTTELNFLLKNDEDQFYKLQLCALIDVCSGKVLGYSFDRSENTEMTLQCLFKSFKNLKVIPRMIVHDNHQSYLSEKFKQASSKMSDFGIILRKCKPRNPRDKGHIERWFDTLKNSYLKYEISYIGDGIRSKREGGRVNKDIEKLYSTKEFIKTENEIKLIVSRCIEQYNSSLNTINKSPSEVFKSHLSKNRIKFKNGDLSYIFLQERIVTVRNSIIVIRRRHIRYFYPITNTYLANKINRSSVIVRFDESDFSKIDVFNNPKDCYEATLFLDRGINIIPDDTDKLKIKEHLKRKKERICQNLDALNDDIEKGWEQLKAIPVLSLDDCYESDEIERYNENKMLLANTYPQKEFKERKINRSKTNTKFLKIKVEKENQYRGIK